MAVTVSSNPAVTGKDGFRGSTPEMSASLGAGRMNKKVLRHALLVYIPESFQNPD